MGEGGFDWCGAQVLHHLVPLDLGHVAMTELPEDLVLVANEVNEEQSKYVGDPAFTRDSLLMTCTPSMTRPLA